jgi:hypothetical protein
MGEQEENRGAIPPLPGMSSWRIAYLIQHREFTVHIVEKLNDSGLNTDR